MEGPEILYKCRAHTFRRAERKSRLKRKKDKLEARVLSFGDEEENEEEEEVVTQVKKKKVGKNPNVDTSFLPDRDREVCSSLDPNALFMFIFSHYQYVCFCGYDKVKLAISYSN